MPIFSFQLYLDSPAFIAGTNKDRPEMRSASIRGQLRYWLRAMVGASTDSLSDIWKAESDIFGSTEKGSQVGIRVFSKHLQTGQVAMLPHKTNERERSPQMALLGNYHAELEIVTRLGVEEPPIKVLNALKVWSLLGGIGKRSRRMFGSVRIVPTEKTTKYWWDTLPKNPQEFAKITEQILMSTNPDLNNNLYGKDKVPPFPTLHPLHSWIVVGTKPIKANDAFEIYTPSRGQHRDEEILRMMFVEEFFTKLLRTPEHRGENGRKEKTFGSGKPRRASPLIAQVKLIGDNLYPVLIAIRSSDPNQNIDWNHLKKFMIAATKYYNCITLNNWGGW